ncbi:helix-turn-helix transcriptional regulator [Streptomyces sp. NPDC048057]|uniref:helix-turn-helix transcriptional regulator n=1 Tax=Streptomyces sp. NPDC048057 TaxID=3155628 RepID=UPI0033C2EC2E
MTDDNRLGEFLRARRAAVGPQDVGIASHGARRVAGLRREEVAVLAGVNGDYYARLEQGRERHPSAQVLDALGRALRLNDDAHAHLFRLAGVAPSRGCAPTADRVSPALRQLVDSSPRTVAFVIGPALDLLAANALAKALHSPFEKADNLARMIFLAPEGRWFYTRWSDAAHGAVGHLRQAAGSTADDPRLRDVVDDLTERSPDFARLWHSHEVLGKRQDAKHLHHPDVGPLALTYQTFDVRDAPGQQLVVYQAEPDSSSAHALDLLGSLHVTSRRAAP